MKTRKAAPFILLTALVYLVFSCAYVLLCKKNNAVVHLFKQQYTAVKSAGKNNSARSVKFLSRPRVITNRPVNLLSIAVLLITLAVFFIRQFKHDYLSLRSTAWPHKYPPQLSLLRTWRI